MSVITTQEAFPNLRHFEFDEFRCSHTGNVAMEEMFLQRLDTLRDRCDFPFELTSAYRAPTHPTERKKERPGRHSQGIAVDIAIRSSMERYKILSNATAMGFSGIGVYDAHVHIDDRGWLFAVPSVLWIGTSK